MNELFPPEHKPGEWVYRPAELARKRTGSLVKMLARQNGGSNED